MGVYDCVSAGVVVEVGVDVTTLCSGAGDALGPEGKLGITKADTMLAVVKAKIAKRPNVGCVERRRECATDGDDQRRAGVFEQAQNLGLEPGRIAELECGPILAWQPCEECREPRWIGVPMGWQLVEKWPELVAEPFGCRDEPRKPFFDAM